MGNPAHNVIPARATAKFNIRFNTHHTGNVLTDQLLALAATHQVPGIALDLDIRVTGESFYTPPGRLTDILQTAVKTHTNTTPALTTGGGTSDARFIKDYCPVAELGLKNDTAHQVDEFTEVTEISTLTDIYTDVLRHYFSG